MTDREKLENMIYRWIFATEVNYQNRYIDVLNNFMKFKQHDISDYFKLYQAELEYQQFKRFSDDLSKLLAIR